jgi:hypothetical protein
LAKAASGFSTRNSGNLSTKGHLSICYDGGIRFSSRFRINGGRSSTDRTPQLLQRHANGQLTAGMGVRIFPALTRFLIHPAARKSGFFLQRIKFLMEL